MSEDTVFTYEEITGDMEMSAYQIWDRVHELATIQNRPAPTPRHGVDGYLWEGSLLSVMEEIWPQLGGEVRTSKEVNAVRRLLHQWLTRRGMIHCDIRGGGSGAKPSVWWVRIDWNPQNQSQPSRWADPDVEVETEDVPAEDFEAPTQFAEDEEGVHAYRLRQMLTIILAAQEAGAPLTTTALGQIPTGVSGYYRRELLNQLESCGAVEYRDIRVPSGHTVGVWVGTSEVPSWLSVEGMPEDYTLPEEWAGQEISAADILAQFLEDFRSLDQALRDAQDRLEKKDERDEELASLRQQLATIRKAVKG